MIHSPEFCYTMTVPSAERMTIRNHYIGPVCPLATSYEPAYGILAGWG
jgi:hypothetical protein